MDNDYVITPATDQDKLDRDYESWLSLPMKFKLISNNSCYNRHGFNVDDFYHKLKQELNKSRDDDYIEDDNNLVTEAVQIKLSESVIDNIKSDDGYEDSLDYSRNLQISPYIIIIDPCDDEETINNKMNSFSALSSKQRDLSNYYSWIAWGYNVLNMYEYMKSYIDTADTQLDPSNISVVRNYEECVQISYDYINKAIIEGDILTVEKFKQTYKVDSINEAVSTAIIDRTFSDIFDKSIDNLVFPKVVPWFTEEEMRIYSEGSILYRDMNYYKELTEAYRSYTKDQSEDNKKTLINLGWNPSVPVNKYTIETAMERQIRDMKGFSYANISKLGSYNEANDINYNDINIRPVYFVFFDNKVALAFPDEYSLSPDLKIMYTIDIDDEEYYIGITKITSEDFKYRFGNDTEIKVLSIFMNINAYNSLLNIVKISATVRVNRKKINSVYSVLLNARNKNNPDIYKIIYSYYINIVINLILSDNKYDITKKKMFLLYSGKYSEYNSIIIQNILNIICNDVNIEKYLSANEFEVDNELVDKLKASDILA